MKKMALGVTGGKRLSAYGWLAVFMFVFFTTQTTNQYIQLYLYEVDEDVFLPRELMQALARLSSSAS